MVRFHNKTHNCFVAQLVEQPSFKRKRPGSNPGGATGRLWVVVALERKLGEEARKLSEEKKKGDPKIAPLLD